MVDDLLTVYSNCNSENKMQLAKVKNLIIFAVLKKIKYVFMSIFMKIYAKSFIHLKILLYHFQIHWFLKKAQFMYLKLKLAFYFFIFVVFLLGIVWTITGH